MPADQPPPGYVCERCWLQPAEVPAPAESDLTWTCRKCFDLLYSTDALAVAVNRGGRSGETP